MLCNFQETSYLEKDLAQQLSNFRQPISDQDLDQVLSDHMRNRAALKQRQLAERQRLQDRLKQKLTQQVKQATQNEELQEVNVQSQVCQDQH